MVKLNPRPRSLGTRAADPLKGTAVQLRIDLRFAKPPIWRRIVVPGDIRLDRLHDVLQVAMGWTNSHLHAFRRGNEEYTMPDPEAGTLGQMHGVSVFDERKYTLSALVAAEGDRFQYDYDFGDGWEHDLRVEAITPASERFPARCLAGRRACPPEDCGGIGGYFDLLDALAHPKALRHRELLEWLGEGFDPALFDLDEVNEILREVKV